jgi:hypothetical protein
MIFGNPDFQMKAVNAQKSAAIPAHMTYDISLNGLHLTNFPVIRIHRSWSANTARDRIVAVIPTANNVIPGELSIQFFLISLSRISIKSYEQTKDTNL